MMQLGLVLAILAVNASAAGMRQTAGSNVEVIKCNPHRHFAARAAHPWIDPYGTHRGVKDFPMWDAFLAITYRNRAHTAATEIDFGLVLRHSLVDLAKDVGVFAPGTLIEHEFSASREIFPIGTARPYCAILRVKYADGAVWYNRNSPQEWIEKYGVD